jgi:hypothetical protein
MVDFGVGERSQKTEITEVESALRLGRQDLELATPHLRFKATVSIVRVDGPGPRPIRKEIRQRDFGGHLDFWLSGVVISGILCFASCRLNKQMRLNRN